MKIPKDPGPPPIPPDGARSDRSGEAGRRRSSSSSKQGDAAEKLARAGSNTASNLLKAGGSAAEFATVGMKILTQAATSAGSTAAKGAAGGARSSAEQAWTNVAGAVFGPVPELPNETLTKAKEAAGHVSGGAFDTAAAVVADAVKGTAGTDVNGLIQHVLRESYMEQTKDLQFFADKVRHFNDMKTDLRDQINEMRKKQSSAVKSPADGASPIQELEEKLQTAGDDAQLANLDLQNNLQKAQQTLQTISNVSKMLHDTAMAVIRKIG